MKFLPLPNFPIYNWLNSVNLRCYTPSLPLPFFLNYCHLASHNLFPSFLLHSSLPSRLLWSCVFCSTDCSYTSAAISYPCRSRLNATFTEPSEILPGITSLWFPLLWESVTTRITYMFIFTTCTSTPILTQNHFFFLKASGRHKYSLWSISNFPYYCMVG